MKWSDVFLLSGSYYRRLNDKKLTLILGIFLVGLIDLGIPYLFDNFVLLFVDKSQELVLGNILTAVISIPLLGAVDVLFFALPLFDLFKVFKKENEIGRISRIRIMKVYISAHLVILPVSLLLYHFGPGTDVSGSGIAVYAALFVSFGIIAWFAAAITRGVNSLYSFEPLYRRLVFAVVLVWNFLLGTGLSYIIDNWLWKLFM